MEDKSALRRRMKAAREGWEAEYRQEADAAIARHVLASGAWRAAGTVFAYVSVGCEVDTRALIEAALKEGKRVCAPRCLGKGRMEARAVEQTSVFEAAEKFARVEGILPAPESSHAIKAAIDEAMKCKETGEEKTILFGLTGTGYFDMYAYEKFHNGEMTDYIPTDEDLKAGFDGIPRFPGNME